MHACARPPRAQRGAGLAPIAVAVTVAVALGLAAASCHDESTTFTRNLPELVVTANITGHTYASYDDPTRTIDLGEVPVFGSRLAVFDLENPTAETLTINAVKIDSSSGERWRVYALDLPPVRQDAAWPKRLDPVTKTKLTVVYAPLAEGQQDFAHLAIECDAGNALEGVVDVTVHGTGGPPLGAPDIAVAYQSYTGPSAADCATRFDGDTPVIETDERGEPIINICRVPEASALSFGNIGLGAEGTVRLRLLNTAECPVVPQGGECETCAIEIAKDPEREGIGFGFRPDSNPSGAFWFEGSTATPFFIRQRNLECDEDGEVPLSLKFTAPLVEGEYRAVIVVESNDPDEPLIEIPVVAFARNAPIAVASFRHFDPNNPSAPYTNPDNIEPLGRVYFDGRNSYDPRDPDDPLLIADYFWQVIEAPPGLNPHDFAEQGQHSPLYSFGIPLAGHYEVKLTVTNVDGIMSGDTPESRVEFDAIPSERLHVQLVWDDATNDQDLHMTLAAPSPPGEDLVCGDPYDCYYSNKTPTWYADAPDANPTLDIDDTDGIGPENINIDEPLPGTYRIYVHYYREDHNNPTRNTVRIYLNGVQRAEYRRTLREEGALWAVGDIIWGADGSAEVVPYPSDVPTEVGSMRSIFPSSNCEPPGCAFEECR